MMVSTLPLVILMRIHSALLAANHAGNDDHPEEHIGEPNCAARA
jgi:hypothetical protein